MYRRKIEGVLPRWKLLSGSSLKCLALLSMLIDHVGGWIIAEYPWAWEPMLVLGKTQVSWMFICRAIIGRLAFPLFSFLLVEGYVHTHNRKHYLYTMIAWAVATQPCFNLMRGVPWYSFWNGQNVLFTFVIGLIALMVYSSTRIDSFKKTLCWLLLMSVAYLCRTDYNATGVAFILLLYVLRGNLGLVMVATLSCFLKKWPFAGLSWLMMTMYNGKRGFIRGKTAKHLFYALYPLHMLIIWALRAFVL